ncbi:hypothetical protein JTF08_12390 [Micrococcaceae bacterium RIT802]|nr:hypothetical protein [Micrococcaceae bacterium RIT 802]
MSASVLPARVPATVRVPSPARPAGRATPGRVGLPGRTAGLAAAVLTAASLVVHVVMIAGGGHGVALGILLAAMALSCAGCAAHAALRPGCRGSLALVGMSIGMALLHAVMALGLPGGPGMHAMHDGGSHLAGSGAGPAGAGHAGLMLLVIVLELAVAWFAAYGVHRARSGAARGRMRA